MIIRRMTGEDIRYMNIRDGWWKQRYEAFFAANLGEAWIAEDENGPIAAFGGALLWDGVAEMWFNIIRKTQMISLMHRMKRNVESKMKEYHIRRLQATINADFSCGKKFMKFFGFKRESSRMVGYCPDGKDAFMYARTL